VKIKVLNLDAVPDSSGEVFDPAGISIEAGTVPVRFEFRDDLESVMGQAQLSREADGIYATLDLLPRCLETAKLLYPAVGGVVRERMDKVLLKTEIRMVGLSTHKNADSRIPSVGDQVAP
jgi:hypothetical protein